jgi:DNA invertase Pin-like site-specific DNA recombinase
MKNVYGYIRVSGKKQIEGASLVEQRRIISEYARANGLNIIHFFEETKTAAKRGRPFFSKMMKNLKQGRAEGVIIHKIDRSARNLHDWADIGDLIDNNIAVYFAHESLNLNERSGRLSADIQAVMASDYVRNLKQEINKGIQGRLRAGYYPSRAPVGYQDNGRGQLKTIDPIQGKLVKKLFSLYATKQYNIETLSEEMKKRGLKNFRGNSVCKNGISRILHNPFYMGIIKMKGETYEGKHEPLISSKLFKRVQLIMSNRINSSGVKHDYIFRKKLRCKLCNYCMPGERQKGVVYYRCQTKDCPTKGIREDHVERYVTNFLMSMKLHKKEVVILTSLFEELEHDSKKITHDQIDSISLQINKLESDHNRLLDAYIDGLIEKEIYSKKKQEYLFKKKEFEEYIQELEKGKKHENLQNAKKFLELSDSPVKYYNSGNLEEKRELLKNVSSNLLVTGKGVEFLPLSPYNDIVNRDILVNCDESRGIPRTLTSKIIYTDKNTSGITIKPLGKKKVKRFFDILMKKISLSDSNHSKEDYELPKDHPSTQ